MKDNIRLFISFGSLAILGLMITLVSVSLFQLQSSTDSMDRLAEVANIKTASASEMRDAIHMRRNSLKSMRLAKNIFDRDEEHQRFTGFSVKYRVAREKLASLGMDHNESNVFEKLAQLRRTIQPVNDKATQLLMSEAPAREVESVMGQVDGYQEQLLGQLDRLVKLEQEKARDALSTSRKHYQSTRWLLFVLAGITLVFCMLAARMVILRVSEKNRQLSYQASHDGLTGLINRGEFEVRVERAIRHAQTHSVTHALLYIDLDQFKLVNDTCGHSAGDEMLQQLSQLLLSAVRNRDTLGRLGGDEFGMLLENCPLDKAVEIAKNLLTSLKAFCFSWDGNAFTPDISIGVVPIDLSTSDIASTMSAADSACSIAKESGHNQIQIAHPGDRRLQERHGQMQWAPRLTRALEEDRFTLYFQPIVPCASTSRHDKHIEILLRMIDDDGSIISPGVFLPAAEKYKLITNIDRWVIRNALTWLAMESAYNHWPIMISINLSGQSIGDMSMLNYIIDLIDKTGISPERVCFEIPEVAAVSNITAATSFILTLRGCGFRFSLDEFGSGLSSFAYLKKLPVDYLKIDGMFVRDIMSDPVDRAMVKSINELGHLLGKKTIAEFVETMDVAIELKKIGVDYAQGYAFYHPQSLDDFSQVMGPRLFVVSS
ncbi:MAG: EAL domain-containing protein [Pseudomonadota bacterium]|nr:EAL domain-containing protein [Pseudomonadota bacterium]